jgi:hypothetical protein
MPRKGSRPATRGSFVKGDPRAGRPLGRKNNATEEARQLAQSLVTDPEYLKSLRQRLKRGQAGLVEVRLWEYAFGVPKRQEVSGEETLQDQEAAGRTLEAVLIPLLGPYETLRIQVAEALLAARNGQNGHA